MENKYNISYTPASNKSGLITVVYIPIEAWNEGLPRYTEEEVNEVVKFIHNYPIPIPKDNDLWYDFRTTLNNEIYKLYGK